MSRGLKQSAAEMETKAQKHTILLKRTLQDYNDSVLNSAHIDPKLRMKKEHEIERTVKRIARVHKALKRIRKKMGKTK